MAPQLRATTCGVPCHLPTTEALSWGLWAASPIPEPAALSGDPEAAEDLAIKPTIPTLPPAHGGHGGLPGRSREPRGCLGKVHEINPISGAVTQLSQVVFSQVCETPLRAAQTTSSSTAVLFLQ